LTFGRACSRSAKLEQAPLCSRSIAAFREDLAQYWNFQELRVFANAIKHDFRSKNPTTRWSDIIKLR